MCHKHWCEFSASSLEKHDSIKASLIPASPTHSHKYPRLPLSHLKLQSKTDVEIPLATLLFTDMFVHATACTGEDICPHGNVHRHIHVSIHSLHHAS